MDQYIGKVLGKRYEILEKIGSGGMAVVYKAKCHWLNRFVAIKILKEDLAQDEDFRHRFHEESQAVAMLSHPNIVSIYDVSRSEDTDEPDYIVMELIDGITLKQYMQKKGGRLNWKESLHFITQIMKGLSHAHGRGIIHRDIKPHNIMVLRDGSVKVADFGIARLISSAQSTMTQEALGSVHYISPEQARGSHVDARSDIYSAGVVLYEMLTGRLPYEGDSPVAVAIQHINSIPLSPRELDASIPEAMEEITMKAMASDVNKRYLSADAMLVDLEEFRKNPNISFDYTQEDLLVGDGEEPTQNIGANTPQVVTPRPVHAERYEEKKKPRKTRPVEDDEDDYDDRGGGGLRALVIVATVLLCLGGVAAFIWNTILNDMMLPGTTYEVPDLRGYTLEEAAALPEVVREGFTIVEGDYMSSEDVRAGHIISQSPEPNTMVKAGGQSIRVNISTGKDGIRVPNLYNKERRVATNELTSIGLEAEVIEEYSEDITKGNVMRQLPGEGELLEPGDVVTIVVSLGRELKEFNMISVTNIPLEDAVQMLTDMGLSLGEVTPVPNDEVEEGLVCWQSVEVNTPVMEGTAVDLNVSAGPDDPSVTPGPGGEETIPPDETETPSRPPVTHRKDGTVDLPNDRDTVTVVVTVDGVEQYRQTYPTNLRSARFTIEGSGSQEVIVYIDGEPVKRYVEDFGS